VIPGKTMHFFAWKYLCPIMRSPSKSTGEKQNRKSHRERSNLSRVVSGLWYLAHQVRVSITVSKLCSPPIIQPCGRRYRATSVRYLNRRLRVIARAW
jgi:hypothetical protein